MNRLMLQLLVMLSTVGAVTGVALAASAGFSPGTTFRDCDVCPEMVVIPAGSFMMGASASDQGRNDDEGPQRLVNIPRALAVGKHEVTRGQYAHFVKETGRVSGGCMVLRTDTTPRYDPGASWRTPGFAQTDTHPVVCANWNDAKAYAAWLSRKSGKNYRLLSEAEWEYAARAGTTTAYYWGDNANNACQHANVPDHIHKTTYPRNESVVNCTDKHVHTSPVGSFKPNAFGLYDMTGNVSEWTEDCWNANYSGAPANGGAWVSGDCAHRVQRGGSWIYHPSNLRSAFRSLSSVSDRNSSFGFRVARTQ